MVEAEVVVCEMDGLQYCLVLAVCLHRKLQDGEHRFFADCRCNLTAKVLAQVVHWVELHVDAIAGALTTLFREDVIDIVN